MTQVLISSELPEVLRGDTQIRDKKDGYSNERVAVYPNPFRDKLLIDIKSHKNLDISIVYFFGQVVFQKDDANKNLEIPTSKWINGLYIITITQADQVLHLDKCFLIK